MTRRIVTLLLIVIVFACLAILLPRYLSLDFLVRHEDQIRTLIRTNPVQAWFLGCAIYFALSLVPGTSGKSIAFGWVFGFWQGLLISDLALTGAAVVTYFVGRYVLRDIVEQRFAAFLPQLRKHLEQEGAFYLLTLRLAHVPFTLVNYSCGAVNVRTRTFVWTTLCGLLPGCAVFVFAGTRLPTLREMQERGIPGLVDPGLIVALVGTACLPTVIRWMRRRARISS